jgi:hypothetical protein
MCPFQDASSKRRREVVSREGVYGSKMVVFACLQPRIPSSGGEKVATCVMLRLLTRDKHILLMNAQNPPKYPRVYKCMLVFKDGT